VTSTKQPDLAEREEKRARHAEKCRSWRRGDHLKTEKELLVHRSHMREAARRNRLRNAEKIKATHRVYLKRWKKENADKLHARQAIENALRRGKLTKPSRCQMQISPLCGRLKNLDAHHEDYSKPLEVVWACRDCHMQHHSKVRAGGWR
jgi:hypothetical protein